MPCGALLSVQTMKHIGRSIVGQSLEITPFVGAGRGNSFVTLDDLIPHRRFLVLSQEVFKSHPDQGGPRYPLALRVPIEQAKEPVVQLDHSLGASHSPMIALLSVCRDHHVLSVGPNRTLREPHARRWSVLLLALRVNRLFKRWAPAGSAPEGAGAHPRSVASKQPSQRKGSVTPDTREGYRWRFEGHGLRSTVEAEMGEQDHDSEGSLHRSRLSAPEWRLAYKTSDRARITERKEVRMKDKLAGKGKEAAGRTAL